MLALDGSISLKSLKNLLIILSQIKKAFPNHFFIYWGFVGCFPDYGTPKKPLKNSASVSRYKSQIAAGYIHITQCFIKNKIKTWFAE